MEIRPAEIKDLEELKKMEQKVVRYERQFASNLKDDPIIYYDLIDLILREDAQILVAVINGEIIGSGYALIKESVPHKNPEKYAYFGFMYVSPKFRGSGINGKIIENLIDWAKSRNLTDIQLDVYAENESAIKAYTKKHFKPDLMKMRLSIEK